MVEALAIKDLFWLETLILQAFLQFHLSVGLLVKLSASGYIYVDASEHCLLQFGCFSIGFRIN